MSDKKFCYEFPRAAITTDCVVFGFDDGVLKVLLIQRAAAPCKDQWAFPGGFLDMDETAAQCAARELEEETGLCGVSLEQLYSFSAIDRDPRGRTITIAYWGVIDNIEEKKIQANDDAKAAEWFALKALPKLAFDHADVLQVALNRIKTKVRFKDVDLSLS